MVALGAMSATAGMGMAPKQRIIRALSAAEEWTPLCESTIPCGGIVMFGNFLKKIFKRREMGMRQGFTIREAPGPRRPYPPPSGPPRP